ncbi:hypothetical protein M3Y95_00605100 [Aphelenchoides besseyi]|nr:hypothetical protein M3Y95_00605100 [Aphelenchoides besseyi]
MSANSVTSTDDSHLDAPSTPTIGSATPPRVVTSNSGELSGGPISNSESNSKRSGSDEARLDGGDRSSPPSTDCASGRRFGDVVVMPVEDEQEMSEDELRTELASSEFESDGNENERAIVAILESKTAALSIKTATETVASLDSGNSFNSRDHAVVLRPNLGRAGRMIPLCANFYEIYVQDPTVRVHQYHVEVRHERIRALDRDEARAIFWRVVDSHRQLFGSPYGVAYDGGQQMYTTEKLACGSGVTTLEAEVRLPRDSGNRDTRCKVVLQFTGSILLKDMTRSQNPLDAITKQAAPIQVLDIIVRQALTCPLYGKSSGFYAWKNSCYRFPGPGNIALNLEGGKELWNGFFASAHLGQGYRPLLNVDVSHTAFYKPRLNIIQFMCEILAERNFGGRNALTVNRLNETSTLSSGELRAFNDALRGLRVRSTHGNNIRTYRVNQVKGPANVMTFAASFTNENGETIERMMTVADYFKERYSPLQFPSLPCLHVGPLHRNILLPIEACALDAPQKFTKSLTEHQTSKVIRATAVDAQKRKANIHELCDLAGFKDDPFLRTFGLKISSNMVETCGRVLDPPQLAYHNGQKTLYPKDGSWPVEDQLLFMPAECTCYIIFALVDEKEQENLKNFCQFLARKARAMGLRFPDWPEHVTYVKDAADLQYSFQKASEYYTAKNRVCDLALVLMPSKNNDIYMVVKELTDIKYGIMSQCLLMKNVVKPTSASAANIILKLNMKLGGVNSCLIANNVSSRYLVNRPVLILGIDVTHPTQVEERIGMPSVAAVVGNLDTLPQVYGANVKVQRRCRESVVYVTEAVRERVVSFLNSTSRLPERILVYRDGVSSGQFAEVLREELNGIRAACSMITANYRPPITYIVVQKRHHARLFCKDQRDTVGRARNVPPGTVVDTGICSPESFDFYLCSHFGIQGTSRPARYQVLCDDSGFSADELQGITYNLCHTYGRCGRSVSIPAPTFYADLVATRARCHLKRHLTALHYSGARAKVPNGSNEKPGSRRQDFKQADQQMQSFVSVTESFKDRMYFV